MPDNTLADSHSDAEEAGRTLSALGTGGHKLDGRLGFTIEIVDEIPLTPRGKAIYVDQRIPQQEKVF